MVAITGTELLNWLEATSQCWKRQLLKHPEILAFECDIRETKSVAGLVQHIVAVELRYAERLNGLPETPYDQIPCDNAESLYRNHNRALELLRPLLAKDSTFWEEVLEMETRNAGTVQATRRTVLMHLVTHSIRHYAQLGTLARKEGVPPNFPMDYLPMQYIHQRLIAAENS